MYESFAEVYDALMDDFDYAARSRYYLQIMKAAGFRGGSLCECACGTGGMTVPFARAGLRVTASDLSGDMLRLAANRALSAGVRVPFVQQDMRHIALHRPVDAVAACCDAVNYLTGERDVRAFFQSAHAALKPGGVLAFDISSRRKLEGMSDGFYGEDRGDIAYLWQNSYDPLPRLITMDLTFFVKDHGGLYRRFDETHVQRAHDEGEIASWLQDQGYQDIRIYGDMTLSAPTDGDMRIHFTARRGE